MQAIILAGGKGTRFQKVSKTIPKILIPIGGKPLLDYLVDYLKRNGVDNIIICTGHLGEKVKEYLKKKDYGLNIQISQEEKPLGTAGALHLISDKLEDKFFVIYGDEYTTINLRKMLDFHRKKGGEATLILHKSDHPQDSTVAKIDKNNSILNLVEKPGDDWKKFGNLTVTPLFVLKRNIVKYIDKSREVDFTKDVFPKMIQAKHSLFGYVTEEYVKDIGTSKRYSEVKKYVIKYLRK